MSQHLGTGEREAIRLAQAYHAVLLLDERHARAEAERLGIPLMGTLAVLEKAKRQNLISPLGGALDRLRATGFHLSSRLRDEVLGRVGEL